eukprot:CAMPEP_0113878304 /NCGR_PEP_ID=MMETSP0780_2-20120614/6600_1 /TAXON_ID=652834 /ORGANISM="Palpitomonas bilix" /LENGTH=147 /DNA_ID=CAMNT_0000864743 /DNA_START=238 /DNA_END=681 /DNA_ORIENTATION=- /assembly_acc=CAM_ASM_000599
MKEGMIYRVGPTQRANEEDVIFGRTRFHAWDLGGHELVRDLWSEYTVTCDAVVFVVDSADVQRLNEAKEELDILLKLVDAKDTPFVVLANKCDLDSSLPYNEFLNRFKLGNYINTTSDDQRKFNVFRTSFTEGTGVEEAFRWLNSVL